MAKTLVNQSTAAPTNKVAAAGLGGLSGASLATVFLVVIKLISPENYATITSVPSALVAIGSLFTAALAFVSAYMRRERG